MVVSLKILNDVIFDSVICVMVNTEPSPNELYGVTMYV